jgi:DNA-binding PadR family transcriptional regulator
LADRPLHGYELKAAYEEELVPSPDTQLNYGQVYTTLERLARDGLVEHEKVSQSERPDKKVYVLTEKGRQQLHDWFAKPAPLDLDLRNETFLKLMLALRLRGFDPLTVLAGERRSAFARLHEVTQARAEAIREPASIQMILLLDLAMLRLDAFVKWLDRCEEAMKKEKRR